MNTLEARLLAHASTTGWLAVDQQPPVMMSRPSLRNVLLRLHQKGLSFPIYRGRYAVPDEASLAQALQQDEPLGRIHSWLFRWIANHHNELPHGLDWSKAVSLAAALEHHTQLIWDGPILLVPIADETTHLDLYQKLSAFVVDPLGASSFVDLDSLGVPNATPDEVVRVLALHQDPRLREAARALAKEVDPEVKHLVKRAAPPMPFPDPDAALPRGPPFRYRMYGPLGWIKRNISHAYPVLD